jgi:hypothetical protein
MNAETLASPSRARNPDFKFLVGATLLFLAVTVAIDQGRPNTEHAFQPVIGTVKPKGSVERRPNGELVWETLQGERDIHLKDFVHTSENSSATIVMGKDGAIELGPNTVVQFDDTTTHSIHISLLQGVVKTPPNTRTIRVEKRAASLNKVANASRRRSLPSRLENPADLANALDSVTRAVAALPAKPLALESVTPPAHVNVHVHQLERLSEFKIDLLFPQAQATQKADWVEFRWSQVPLSGTNYELQISTAPDFEYFVSHEGTKSKIRVEFNRNGTFYWRVKAVLGKENFVSEGRKLLIRE